MLLTFSSSPLLSLLVTRSSRCDDDGSWSLSLLLTASSRIRSLVRRRVSFNCVWVIDLKAKETMSTSTDDEVEDKEEEADDDDDNGDFDDDDDKALIVDDFAMVSLIRFCPRPTTTLAETLDPPPPPFTLLLFLLLAEVLVV